MQRLLGQIPRLLQEAGFRARRAGAVPARLRKQGEDAGLVPSVPEIFKGDGRADLRFNVLQHCQKLQRQEGVGDLSRRPLRCPDACVSKGSRSDSCGWNHVLSYCNPSGLPVIVARLAVHRWRLSSTWTATELADGGEPGGAA